MSIYFMAVLVVSSLFATLYLLDKYRLKKAIQGLRILVYIDKSNVYHTSFYDGGSSRLNTQGRDSGLTGNIVARLNMLGAFIVGPSQEDKKIHDSKHDDKNPFPNLEADFKIIGTLEEYTDSTSLKYIRGSVSTVRRFVYIGIYGTLFPSSEIKMIENFDKEYGEFGEGYDRNYFEDQEARIIIRKLARLARIYRRQSKNVKNTI